MSVIPTPPQHFLYLRETQGKVKTTTTIPPTVQYSTVQYSTVVVVVYIILKARLVGMNILFVKTLSWVNWLENMGLHTIGH